MDVIQEEEKKEKKRESEYNKEQNLLKKGELDKKHSEERIQASNKIIELSQ